MNHANVVTRLRILVSVVVISVMAGSVVAADSPSANTPVENVNWESFLAQHDPVWTRLPLGWHEGPFIGNGTLGTIAYVDPEHRHGLRFEIGRSDVYDHRENSKLHPVLSNCRLPIGHFQLIPVGTIKDGSADRSVERRDPRRNHHRPRQHPLEGLCQRRSGHGDRGGKQSGRRGVPFRLERGTGHQSLLHPELEWGQERQPRAYQGIST